MAHALLSGTGPRADTVAALLGKWGFTFETLADRSLEPDGIAAHRCDVIILICAGGADPAHCPLPAAKGTGSIPLLLVGGTHGSCRCHHVADQRIGSLGRDGEWLRLIGDVALRCAAEFTRILAERRQHRTGVVDAHRCADREDERQLQQALQVE